MYFKKQNRTVFSHSLTSIEKQTKEKGAALIFLKVILQCALKSSSESCSQTRVLHCWQLVIVPRVPQYLVFFLKLRFLESWAYLPPFAFLSKSKNILLVFTILLDNAWNMYREVSISRMQIKRTQPLLFLNIMILGGEGEVKRVAIYMILKSFEW